MADKCKRNAPTFTVMESSPSSSSDVMSKRRRIACLDAACQFQLPSPDIEVEDSCHSFKFSHEMRASSPVNSVISGEVSSASCCAGNEASKVVDDESSSVLDLEAKGFKTKYSTDTKLKSFSTFNVFSGDSDELELLKKSSSAFNSNRRISPTVNMPPQDEIEEFFSVTEKYQQKRFAEKYNYDIVEDAPLEGGRYQWVRFEKVKRVKRLRDQRKVIREK